MDRKTSLRQSSGVSAVETAVAAFFLIVMAAIAVDLTVLTLGFTMLDTAARDAARGAANQPDYNSAVKAALNQISVHQTDGVFVKQPILSGGSPGVGPAQGTPNFVYQDWSVNPTTPPNVGNPSSPQNSYVTVTVQEDIHLPVNVPFFGNNLNSTGYGWTPTGYFTIARRYTFPIVKEKFRAGP